MGCINSAPAVKDGDQVDDRSQEAVNDQSSIVDKPEQVQNSTASQTPCHDSNLPHTERSAENINSIALPSVENLGISSSDPSKAELSSASSTVNVKDVKLEIIVPSDPRRPDLNSANLIAEDSVIGCDADQSSGSASTPSSGAALSTASALDTIHIQSTPLAKPIQLARIAYSSLLVMQPISSSARMDVYKCKGVSLPSASSTLPSPSSASVTSLSLSTPVGRQHAFSTSFEMSPLPSTEPLSSIPSALRSESPTSSAALPSSPTSSSNTPHIVQQVMTPLTADLVDQLCSRLALPPHPHLRPLVGICYFQQFVHFVTAAPSEPTLASLLNSSAGTFFSRVRNGVSAGHVLLLQIFIPIADALCLLHDFGLFHGQVTCPNILVQMTQNPQLPDELPEIQNISLNNFWLKTLSRAPFAKIIAKQNVITSPSPESSVTSPAPALSSSHHHRRPSRGSRASSLASGVSSSSALPVADSTDADEEMINQGDVWSIAVCMCQALIGSEDAYRQSLAKDFNGDASALVHRLAHAHSLPNKLVALMTSCLSMDVRSRPSMRLVHQTLRQILNASTSPV